MNTFRKNNKKTISIISASAVVVFCGIYFLFFNTYSVSGKIIDLASKEPVADVEISVGNFTTITNEEGLFVIEKIKKYKSNTLEIKNVTGYEEIKPILLEFGKNNIQNIEIAPTLETMVLRFIDATRSAQYDYLWDYMHPDDQDYWGSKWNYVSVRKKVENILADEGLSNVFDFEIGKNIRKLNAWKHEITDRAYADVTEVPIEYKINENEKDISLSHYQKINEVWRIFTSIDKKEFEETIDAYEYLQKLISS